MNNSLLSYQIIANNKRLLEQTILNKSLALNKALRKFAKNYSFVNDAHISQKVAYFDIFPSLL